jgi:nitroreductase
MVLGKEEMHMELDDLLQKRRSIRQFEEAHVMPDDDLHAIVDAARSTPTSFNIQNWRFVAVRDRGIKEKIKRAAWDQAQVGINSVLLVLCADVKAWDRDTERYWQANGEETAAAMTGMTKGFYKGRDEVQRDEAMRSVGMAATAIMLKAEDLGYATSPMIGFDPAAVGAAINLPEDHVVGMMIAIGRPTAAPYPKTTLPRGEVMVYDFFPA